MGQDLLRAGTLQARRHGTALPRRRHSCDWLRTVDSFGRGHDSMARESLARIFPKEASLPIGRGRRLCPRAVMARPGLPRARDEKLGEDDLASPPGGPSARRIGCSEGRVRSLGVRAQPSPLVPPRDASRAGSSRAVGGKNTCAGAPSTYAFGSLGERQGGGSSRFSAVSTRHRVRISQHSAVPIASKEWGCVRSCTKIDSFSESSSPQR